MNKGFVRIWRKSKKVLSKFIGSYKGKEKKVSRNNSKQIYSEKKDNSTPVIASFEKKS